VTYLLDANVFIQAKNLHYGFDFCPAFWEWLDVANADGRVHSIEKVRDELLAGSDDLADWVKARGDEFFYKPDAAIVPSLNAVSTWAQSAGYHPAAVNTFLQVADYYLVAHAHAHSLVVVTHEVQKNALKKVQIPRPCIELGVKCMTPYEMLRVEKARFTLGPTP
jgi:hypothetical protein